MSPTNLQLIARASHVLERMLFCRGASADEILELIQILNALRWRLETEPAEAAEAFWAIRVQDKAKRDPGRTI